MSKDNGSSGQVYNEKYCMKDSVQAKNVDMMNAALGYENMADLANTKAFPVNMVGSKENTQEGPTGANNKYNY